MQLGTTPQWHHRSSIKSNIRFQVCATTKSQRSALFPETMVTPLIVGGAVPVAALIGRYGIEAWQAYKSSNSARTRRFYEGGFLRVMTRREAALILEIQESAAREKIKEALRRVMQANHPDTGGSDYLASKINEARDQLLRHRRGN